MTDEPAAVPSPTDQASTPVEADPPAPADPAIDLDAIERELAAVDAALVRLSDGTYWTDEVTGEPLPDEVLVADPTARRASTS